MVFFRPVAALYRHLHTTPWSLGVLYSLIVLNPIVRAMRLIARTMSKTFHFRAASFYGMYAELLCAFLVTVQSFYNLYNHYR